jgi:hypothetical protein
MFLEFFSHSARRLFCERLALVAGLCAGTGAALPDGRVHREKAFGASRLHHFHHAASSRIAPFAWFSSFENALIMAVASAAPGWSVAVSKRTLSSIALRRPPARLAGHYSRLWLGRIAGEGLLPLAKMKMGPKMGPKPYGRN